MTNRGRAFDDNVYDLNAMDAAAVTSCPSLRAIPGQHQPVSIDDILEALSELDNSRRR